MKIRRSRKKHSKETREKIACSNTGKIFSEERRKKIGNSRLVKLDDQKFEKLQYLWSLKHLNPKKIQQLVGIGPKVYKRLHKVYCKFEQTKFMPADLDDNDLLKITNLANQNIWYKEIASSLNRGPKQIFSILKKIGIQPITKNPNRKINVSKLELKVYEFLTSAAGYDIESQFGLGNFVFDFKIRNQKILIEVNGDYWHCNPKVYPHPINNWQKFALRRDFAKKAYAKQNGYSLYRIWEKDIKENEIESFRKLQNFIEKSIN